MVQIVVATSFDELVSVQGAWEALSKQIFPRHPFASYQWCRLWWECYHRGHDFIEDRLRVFLVQRDGEIIGIAPMMLTLRPAWGPLRMRELQFIGADTNVTEIRGPICRPDDLEAVVTALRDYLDARSSEWDWIQWRGLHEFDERSERIRSSLKLEDVSNISNYYLPLPTSWAEFHGALPRNIRESIRKCYRYLDRDNISFEFRAVSSPMEIGAAVEEFLSLHQQRSKAENTVHHLNIFRTNAAKSFLRSYAGATSKAGAIFVYQIKIGGQTVAARLAIKIDDVLYLYYSGYDLNFRKYSIMTTLLTEILKWSFDNGVRIANLSTGTDVSKTRWRPEMISLLNGYQVSSTWRARILYRSMALARRWRTKLRFGSVAVNVGQIGLSCSAIPLEAI